MVADEILRGAKMEQKFKTIELEIDGAVGHITLNRPERLNAINATMITDITSALDQLEADTNVRVVVVKGAGRAFSVGYDLKQASDSESGLPYDDTAVSHWEWVHWQLRQFERLWRSAKPTIAQVHGYCYAGGLTIMGFCDLIFAAENALIGQPEVRSQGFSPENGLWHYTIGPRLMKELLFTGRAVNGVEAKEIGMINRAVPEALLDGFTRDFAKRMACQSPDMLTFAKRMVNQQFDIQGLHTSMTAGVNFDFLAHHNVSMPKFIENATNEGLKKAIELRDEPFGGTQRIGMNPWPAEPWKE